MYKHEIIAAADKLAEAAQSTIISWSAKQMLREKLYSLVTDALKQRLAAARYNNDDVAIDGCARALAKVYSKPSVGVLLAVTDLLYATNYSTSGAMSNESKIQ